MTEEEEIKELNRLYLIKSTLTARRPLWRRIWWPSSYWPLRETRTCGWWHLYWHGGAALARLHIYYLGKRGY